MPPVAALTLSLGFILVLLASERRMNPDVSPAVWIPFLWMFFIGTRFPSLWIDLGSWGTIPADGSLDSSPFNQAVFLALYAAALIVLARRHISVGAIIAANAWISLFLLFGLLSVAWSDYPWTALKRFLKVLEHVVMVLVILTEAHPAQALDALFRRFLAVSVVLSVVMLKYFPELSRAFDVWTGEAFNLGVTTDKNGLGYICFLAAAFYTSSLLHRAHRNLGRPVKGRRLIDLALLAAAAWLLSIADAKTALVCTLLTVASIIVLARTGLGRNPKAAFFALVSCTALVAGLEWAFNLRDLVFEALNREPTLTDRTYVWADVLAIPNNVLLGTGFESFWLGPRLEVLWEKYWWQPNQAHNGYIETYINLGAIGLALMVLMMIAGLLKSFALLASNGAFEPVRIGLLLAIALFNYTEATFKAVHILFFTFFLMSISLPAVRAFSGVSATPLNAASRNAIGNL